MNDNNLNNNTNNANSANTYHATSNLNTAIENPQMNVNSATGVNIKDLGQNNYADTSVNDNSSNFLNNSVGSIGNSSGYDNYTNQNNFKDNLRVNDNSTSSGSSFDNNYQSYSNQVNNNYSYEPVMEEKKRAGDNAFSNLIHSKEFKIMIFIIFILVLFLLLMPYIYDFFRELQMSMTA